MRSSGSGKAWEKMSKARSKKAALRYEGPWLPAVSSFVAAFDGAIKAIGQDRYRESWGHPFPTEASVILSGYAGG